MFRTLIHGWDAIARQLRPILTDQDGSPRVASRVYTTVLQDIPGIGTGAAYAANDAFGGMGIIAVPPMGTITGLTFHDLDAEGLAKTMFLYRKRFTATADNAALDISVVDNHALFGHISLAASDIISATTTRLGSVKNINLDYTLPDGVLYYQFRTEGADNIAAGAIPKIELTVLY